MDKKAEEHIDLIVGHLNSDNTEDESKRLNEWLSGDELNKKLFDEVRDLWLLANQSNRNEKFDTLTALENVKKKIRKKQKKIVLSVNSILYRVAAIFVISFAIGVIVHYLYNNSKNLHTGKQLAELIEINAPKGSKSFVKLPDGSQVWLNSDSKLFYSSDFGKNERTVKLVGEAFFDVEKNKDLPFKVNTSEVTINVTGTMFNLKAYPDENTIETTLEEGEVIIEKKDSKNKEKIVTLKPKQRAVFTKDKNETIVTETENPDLIKESTPNNKLETEPIVVDDNIDTELFTSWKENKLVFRDEKLKEVFVILERWYGVKFDVVDDEILNYHFIGTIENETVTEVMKVIQFTLPIQFDIEQNIITIQQNNCDN